MGFTFIASVQFSVKHTRLADHFQRFLYKFLLRRLKFTLADLLSLCLVFLSGLDGDNNDEVVVTSPTAAGSFQTTHRGIGMLVFLALLSQYLFLVPVVNDTA